MLSSLLTLRQWARLVAPADVGSVTRRNGRVVFWPRDQGLGTCATGFTTGATSRASRCGLRRPSHHATAHRSRASTTPRTNPTRDPRSFRDAVSHLMDRYALAAAGT